MRTLVDSPPALKVAPVEANAGAAMTVTVMLSGFEPEVLRGRRLRLRDGKGKLAGEATLEADAGEHSVQISATAPATPGRHNWLAVLSAAPGESAPDGSEGTDVPITVTAHAMRLSVWDVPATLEPGTRFSVRVGATCSAACDLTGHPVEVRDANGAPVGAARLSAKPWPGSTALRHAEIELTAPANEGLHRWEVYVPEQNSGLPHRPARSDLALRVVSAAECSVRVEAVDAASAAPLPRMSVVMHPYRAVTDADGVAELRVARGKYTVCVSGRGRYPVQRQVDVDGDLTTRAPLEAQPPPSKDW